MFLSKHKELDDLLEEDPFASWDDIVIPAPLNNEKKEEEKKEEEEEEDEKKEEEGLLKYPSRERVDMPATTVVEQAEPVVRSETPSKEIWKRFNEEREREEKLKRKTEKNQAEDACIKVFFFVPQLPSSTAFRRWLPKHRHILFGHFGYWIFASLVTASSGTSLKTRCTDAEAALTFICLCITSIMVCIPKFLAGSFRKMFGPTIISFILMFATALSLHQKPLICGFSNTSYRVSQRKQATMWGIVVSIQVIIMIITMLLYLFWHLKHKDEKREAEKEGEEGSEQSDEDSLQGSPASVRWATTHDTEHYDLESNPGN